MFRIVVFDYFSSAHQLKGYQGQCEEVHGHNWKVEVEIAGERLDEIGLLVDFREVKKIMKNILDGLDHKMLNQVPPFDRMNPSSELIAQHIYNRMKDQLTGEQKVYSVTVWESENSRAIYSE